MKRKLLASILALCMVLTLCPVTAFATGEVTSEETAASGIDDGHTAQNSEKTVASGITVKLDPAAEGKVKLTIVYANSADTVALHYKIVDEAPKTPNVGDAFTSADYADYVEYTAENSEIKIDDGKYVVACGVKNGKVVAYGVSAASGITVKLEKLDPAAEGKVKLTIVYANSSDTVVLNYKIVDKAPKAPNVGDAFPSDGYKVYTAVDSKFEIADGKYVVAYGVKDGKVVAYGVSAASDDGYTAQNPEVVEEVKVEPTVETQEQEDGTVTATATVDASDVGSITAETETLTITATTSAETAGTTNVALSGEAVGALASAATVNKNVTVDVQTDAANVTLTSDALKQIKQISDVAGGKPVTLNVTNSGNKTGVTDSAVTEDNSETFGVAVKVDGEEKTISGLHKNPMTLAFKLGPALQAKLASNNPVVFWIDRTRTGSSPVLRRMGGVSFDSTTGAVSFKTSHFSEYIVMNEDDAKSVKATPTEITMSKSVKDGMQNFTVGGYDYYSDCGFKLYVQVKFGDAVAITDRNADTESINVTGKVNSAVEVFEVENTISYNADGSVSTSYLGYGKSA